jgi:flavin reductase (DIM6/NTAB) family NADH-FMN oxidoreductase RutF
MKASQMMREIPANKAYRLLEPGPIVLVTTAAHGRSNVMTMGFHMMVQHDPPLIGCVIGPWDHSFAALQETRECVICIPGIDLAMEVVDIGNCSGKTTDKFARFDLTPTASRNVSPPSIAGCFANIECRIADDAMVESYNLFILEAVTVTLNDACKVRRILHHNGNGTFSVDGHTIDLRDRMVLWKSFQVDL